MTRWRAFYADRQFDSNRYDWAELPDDGVLGVVVKHNHTGGWTPVYGFDWYFHIPASGLIGGNDDSKAEILDRYPGAICKRGQWVPVDQWRKIKREMQRHDG